MFFVSCQVQNLKKETTASGLEREMFSIQTGSTSELIKSLCLDCDSHPQVLEKNSL